MKSRLLLLVLLMVLARIAGAAAAFTPPSYPWHLADIWWESPSDTPDFQELSVDFRIMGVVPDSVDLYIAPAGLLKISGTQLYGGVQTRVAGWPTAQKQELEAIGRGGLFSRWSADTTPLPPDYANGPVGTHYESGGYEGTFLSVRRHIDWKEGWYTYSIRRLSVEAGDHPHAWFGAYIRERATGDEMLIGCLRIDQKDFTLGTKLSAFVEVYGTTSAIPKLSVVFSDPKVNGKPRPVGRVIVNYPAHGIAQAPRFASAVRVDDTVFVSTLPAGTVDGIRSELLR